MILKSTNRAVGLLVIGALAWASVPAAAQTKQEVQENRVEAKDARQKKRTATRGARRRGAAVPEARQPIRVSTDPAIVVQREKQPAVREAHQPDRHESQANRQIGRDHRAERRVSRAQQQQLIVRSRRNITVYNQRFVAQQRVARQRATLLQQQRRLAQYRYQQQYWDRVREQQLALQNARNYNYGDDPYYYTAPSYRYQRSGRYYQTNEYGAQQLRQAVHSGYEQGFYAGQADREDRWNNGRFQDSFAYQDANFGYSGFHVEQSEYNYYFREGFRRGYEDGLNERYSYGNRSSGTLQILGAVLSNILNLQDL